MARFDVYYSLHGCIEVEADTHAEAEKYVRDLSGGDLEPDEIEVYDSHKLDEEEED